eukprot:TRINITY_DN2994_c0_g1_i5.p1 TRINITY_DN2994_c0_g1~~TRINITY_DN2994_c0_g1_i5.p1  ORF type:complete len:213 (+),score=53.09 TRINITY_DN2994_c0_g1_i5:252-890(+)
MRVLAFLLVFLPALLLQVLADAPAKYFVTFETCSDPLNGCNTVAGKFVVEVNRDWSPHGADRFYELVTTGFFKGTRVFRVVKDFVAQWGISGDPATALKWQNMDIEDDSVRSDVSNKKGYLTFATAGPDTRTTQVFVNLKDNAFLDAQNFTPIGKVVKGWETVENFYDRAGGSPDQSLIQSQGNRYLDHEFPELTTFKAARLSTPQESAGMN